MIHIPSCYDTTCTTSTISARKGTETFWHERGSWCVEAPGGLDVCLTVEQYEREELEALEARIIAEYDAD